jgi:P27 family predicted phage terminase small subunit
MGRRGPKPTPTKILAARGSWRAKINRHEPIPDDISPEPPDHLSDAAKQVWFHIIPKLLRLRIVGDIDADALARYCDALVKWRRAAVFLEGHPELVYPIRGPGTPENPNGRLLGLAPYPQNGLYEKYARILDRLEQSFGLTPSARTRITTTQAIGQQALDPNKARFFSAG